MKSKRLLIFIVIVAVILVILICLSALFSVSKGWAVYHNFDGSTTSYLDGAPTINDILNVTKGKNIFFLSKEKCLSQLQTDNWHAVAMVKSFPNKVTVHFIKRSIAVKISPNGVENIYVDSMGYVAPAPEGDFTCLDVTSAFDSFDIVSKTENQKLTFNSEKNNQKLKCVLDVVMALWRCHIEMENIPALLGESDVIYFDEGNLVIDMQQNSKIIVNAPTNDDLQERLIKAFSVYYNAEINLQTGGITITVREDGKITTAK